MTSIRVVIIEDHDLTRIGLRATLQQHAEIEVVGEAADGATGLTVLQEQTPDVAIVDLDLPELDGIEVTRRLQEMQTDASSLEDDAEASQPLPKSPQTKVLILTMSDQEQQVLAAFGAGADSYCVKTIKTDQLFEAIRATYEGHGWIDPAIANVVLKQIRVGQIQQGDLLSAQPIPPVSPNSIQGINIEPLQPDEAKLLESSPLTNRELEVLELIVAGHTNTEIGKKLFLSLGTVKTHVRNILSKLAADDRTQAAVRALRAGLVH